MIVFSVSNIKGGVAKSTTAASLAAGLNKRGARVLMVDSDPQTNLTMCFLDEPEEGSPSLYHVYKDGANIRDLRVNIKPGLDMLIGDLELCSADLNFFHQIGSLNMLNKAIKKVAEDYDYVVVDTPPNLGFLALNAFMASDYIITPMTADTFSLKAIRILKKTLDQVEEDGKDLSVSGVLMTRYDKRTNITKAVEQTVDLSAKLLDTTMFTRRIREATVMKESQFVKKDIFEYAPNSGVAQDYDAFIDELLERI